MGCQKVSPACDGCYAEALMDKRLGRVEWGPHGERVRTSPGNWREPIRWNKLAAASGTRPFVFCASLADVFDNRVPPEWRRDLFDLIRATPHLVWLLLTKRPQNIPAMAEAAGGLPANAAIGTTVEDQTRADLNLPALRRAMLLTDPLFTFVSSEPLLGPIVFGDALHWLGWVITGGETDQGDHKARLSDPAWYRAIRDECAGTDAAFHHKQNGEWVDFRQLAGATGWEFTRERHDGERLGVVYGRDGAPMFGGAEFPTRYPFPDGSHAGPGMVRVGKHLSGRLLDGRTHDAFPKVLPCSAP